MVQVGMGYVKIIWFLLSFSPNVHNPSVGLTMVNHKYITVSTLRWRIFLICPYSSARRGRIYLPQDELALAGLSDDDIFAGKVTDKWRYLMKNQIRRARMFFDEAEKGVTQLNEASRWPVSHLNLSIDWNKPKPNYQTAHLILYKPTFFHFGWRIWWWYVSVW